MYNKDMKQVVIYARVSSKEQEREGFSIPAQLQFLNEYAERNGFVVNKEFVDNETAKKAGRTNFNEMLRYIRKHKTINTILVEKTDRLYRNFKDYVLLDDVEGLEIHLVKEGGILSNQSRSHDKFIHGIKVLMAKNYIDNLSEEVRKGQKQCCEQGLYPTKPPHGYKREDKTKEIKIDPKTAPFVIRAFSLYAQNSMSLDNLCTKLHKEGFIYRDNMPKIYKGHISKILKNIFYTGNFKYSGVLYKGNHEPLISMELFEQAQLAFKKDNKPETHRTHNFLFGGMFVCKHCGSSIVGEIKKGKYVYYHCSDKTKSCTNKKIYLKEEQIEKVFDEAMKNINVTSEHKEALLTALKEIHVDADKFNKEQIAKLQQKNENLRARISRLYTDKLDGVITEEFWEEKHNEWQYELAKTLNKIEAHTKANKNYIEKGVELLELLENLYPRYLQKNIAEKRDLTKIIFSNFFIDGENISYEYKKPFDIFAEGLSCLLNWAAVDSNHRPHPYQGCTLTT